MDDTSILRRYGVAALAVLAAAALRLILGGFPGTAPLAVVWWAMAVAVAGRHSRPPGLFALGLAIVAEDLMASFLGSDADLAGRGVQALVVAALGILVLVLEERRRRNETRAVADVAARRRTEFRLAEERTRVQTLMDHVPDHIYFKDRQSRFILINNAMARLFRLDDPHQAVGKTDFDFFTREHAQPAFDDEQEIMRRGQPIIGLEERETWADGHETWVSTTKVPLRDERGEVIGTFGISRDITEHKKAQGDLQVAKEAAEAASIAKSQFLANMSHEIRTPMSAILGMTELLLEGNLADEDRDFAETIQKSGNSLLVLINDILDFSKGEAGKLMLEAIPFDLALAVEDVAELLAPNAEAKGLELVYRLAPDTPTRLLGDPARLRQVLNNLVGNAIKFTAQGHIFIDVSCVKQEDKLATLRMAVQDTGIGIPLDKLGVVFDKFTQADSSTTREYGGTGLGLAICKQLADAMHGEIVVESQPGVGTTFTMTVNLKIDTDTQLRLPVEVKLTGQRVLVVEGNAIYQRVLAEQLTTWGCTSTCCADAETALAALRGAGADERYQAAIVEARLGKVNGFDLGRAIRGEPNSGGLAMILLTAVGSRGDGRLAKEAGFDGYLVKPVHMVDLRDALAAARQARLVGSSGELVTRHRLAEARGQGSSGTSSYLKHDP